MHVAGTLSNGVLFLYVTSNDMKNEAGFTFRLLAAQVEAMQEHHLIHPLRGDIPAPPITSFDQWNEVEQRRPAC